MSGPLSASTADGSECKIEVTSAAQLGRRFLLQIPGSSYICNSLDRAAHAWFSELKFNQPCLAET
jgi:hypothetical protein